MLTKYKNITTEIFGVTLVLTALCMYFGFIDKSNKNNGMYQKGENSYERK